MDTIIAAVSAPFTYLIPFLVILTVLVFVHELGHFWIARRNGVRVEVFSVGFGPEIKGWTDSLGTRWKISLLPLGGYVKMFGEGDAAGTPGQAVTGMSQSERDVSFHHKRLGQRTAIVAAGPIANFALAIILIGGLYATAGQPYTPAIVGEVHPDGAAAAAGLERGDQIRSVDGTAIDRFEELQRFVRSRPGEAIRLEVVRADRPIAITLTTRSVEETDVFGNTTRIGRIGVAGQGIQFRRHDPASALWLGFRETASVSWMTLAAVGEMVIGRRGTEELGGPLRIAQMSGEAAQAGVATYIWFAALLSINLGLINLFPVPMLDGGHLVYYLFEAVRGRPLSQRAQEVGFRIGLAMVLTLMVFVTWKDLVNLRVVAFVVELFT
jgi:regulator of sigma E protease